MLYVWNRITMSVPAATTTTIREKIHKKAIKVYWTQLISPIIHSEQTQKNMFNVHVQVFDQNPMNSLEPSLHASFELLQRKTTESKQMYWIIKGCQSNYNAIWIIPDTLLYTVATLNGFWLNIDKCEHIKVEMVYMCVNILVNGKCKHVYISN